MKNIWHDVDPKRIRPEDFLAVIEIPKGSKKSMNWTRKQA
jgi:inorganic pyrophosphatase